MSTYIRIGSKVTVGAGGSASINFTSIPSTYTDLLIKASMRWDSSSDGFSYVRFNGDSGGNYSYKVVYGDPNATNTGSVYTTSTDKAVTGGSQWASWTANTFGSIEIYIPNYAGSAVKSFSGEGVGENNAPSTYPVLSSGLWNSTSPITSISLIQASGNWVQYSTASLYGIKKD